MMEPDYNSIGYQLLEGEKLTERVEVSLRNGGLAVTEVIERADGGVKTTQYIVAGWRGPKLHTLL
jgi:hypothetical protein